MKETCDLPFFGLWVKDMKMSTDHWTDEEVGAYFRLLMHQWIHYEIPSEPARRNRICDSLDHTWETVADKFPPAADGRLINQRLESERDRTSHAHRARSEAGRRGGISSGISRRIEAELKAELEAELEAEVVAQRKQPEPEPEPEIKPEPKKKKKAAMPPIPDELDTPEFIKKWDEWLEFRRVARRNPVSPLASKKQFNVLKKVGPHVAIATIDNSIANDWTGLFPEKLSGGGSRKDPRGGRKIASHSSSDKYFDELTRKAEEANEQAIGTKETN